MSDSPYEALSMRLGFPDSAHLRKILELLLTQKEASVAASLPGGPGDVAQKLGIPQDRAKDILEGLWQKGAAFPKNFQKRDTYRFARDLIQLHDATLASKHFDLGKNREYTKAWHTFGMEEFYVKMGNLLPQIFSKPIWRVIPAWDAIKDLEGVEPYENIRTMVDAQDALAVVPCSCRVVKSGVDEPCRFTDEQGTWHCVQFAKGANYVTARDSGKVLTKEEAFDLMQKAAKDGLMHMGPNTKDLNPNTICNCCEDCCEFFGFYKVGNVPPEALTAKSRFRAYVNEASCKGCQDCIDRCAFGAIELIRPQGSKKYKASVDEEKCFGCGVCLVGCTYDAMRFKPIMPSDELAFMD
jgi:ferredoxin